LKTVDWRLKIDWRLLIGKSEIDLHSSVVNHQSISKSPFFNLNFCF